jgi:predicted enzyme related to lactoylglutathione lyase
VVSTLAMALAAACAAQPPANTTPTSNDDIGRFVWQDLMTDDVDAALAFYGPLLGWRFEESTRLGRRYVLVTSGGTYVAGIADVERENPDEPIGQWLSYISVPDIDRAVQQVAAAGGEILVDPVQLEFTRASVVTDPQGALLGLLQLPGRLSPAAAQALDADTFIWRDYLADDVEEALAFYRDVAGFDGQRTPRDDIVHYVLSRGEPRAGLFGIGDEPVKPNWIVYVRVDDPAALARRAEQLGGEVILEPQTGVWGGSLSIVADPNGAALALQQWPPDNTEDR